MRITTKLTIDMNTGAMLDHQFYEYAGPVALCKGDSTLRSQEKSQAAFTGTLMSTFKTQFANQSGILNFLSGKLQPMINNPQGYSPEALAAMRTGATETGATQFGNAQKALQESEAARGGNGLPSGVDAQLTAQNANSAAAQESQAQEGITLQNEQQKQNNFWNATNALNGVAAEENPIGYAGQSTAGSQAVGDLGTAYKNSQSSQLLGALGGLAGGAAGALTSYGLKH